MNKKLQQCGVQLALLNHRVSDDIISPAESYYYTESFKTQKSQWGQLLWGKRSFGPRLQHENISVESGALKCSEICKAWGIQGFTCVGALLITGFMLSVCWNR